MGLPTPNVFNIFSVVQSEEETVEYMLQNGLLPTGLTCERNNCGSPFLSRQRASFREEVSVGRAAIGVKC